MYLNLAFRYYLNNQRNAHIEAVRIDSKDECWHKFEVADHPLHKHPLVERSIKEKNVELKPNARNLIYITLNGDDVFEYFDPKTKKLRFVHTPLKPEDKTKAKLYDLSSEPAEFLSDVKKKTANLSGYNRCKSLIEVLPATDRHRFKVLAVKGFEELSKQFLVYYNAKHHEFTRSAHLTLARPKASLYDFVEDKLNFYENYLGLPQSQFKIAYKLIKLSVTVEHAQYFEVSFESTGPKNRSELLQACKDFDEATTIEELNLLCEETIDPNDKDGDSSKDPPPKDQTDKPPSTMPSASSSNVSTSSTQTSNTSSSSVGNLLGKSSSSTEKANTVTTFSAHHPIMSLPPVRAIDLGPVQVISTGNPVLSGKLSYKQVAKLPLLDPIGSMNNKEHEPDSTEMLAVLGQHRTTIANGAKYRKDPKNYFQSVKVLQQDRRTPAKVRQPVGRPPKGKEVYSKLFGAIGTKTIRKKKRISPVSLKLKRTPASKRSPYELRRTNKRLANGSDGSFISKKPRIDESDDLEPAEVLFFEEEEDL